MGVDAGKEGYQNSHDPVVKMFSALDLDGSDTVSSKYFIQFLADQGLHLETDHRFASIYKELSAIGATTTDYKLTLYEFSKVVGDTKSLLYHALEGKLRVPDFQSFRSIFQEIYDIVE